MACMASYGRTPNMTIGACSDRSLAGRPNRSWHDQSEEEATQSHEEFPTFEEMFAGHMIWGKVEIACSDSSSMSYSGNTYSGSGNKKDKERHVPSNVQFLNMSDNSSTSFSEEMTTGDQIEKALGLETVELSPHYDDVHVVDKPAEAVYKKELEERKDSRVLPSLDQLEDLPSIGSAQHHSNTCKPCVHFQTGKGCIKGKGCLWCHFSHSGFSFSKKGLKKYCPKDATVPEMYSMDRPSLSAASHSSGYRNPNSQSQVLIDELRSLHSGPDSPDSNANTFIQASVTWGSTESTQPSCPRPYVPKQERAQAVGQVSSRFAHGRKLGIQGLFGSTRSDQQHAEDAGQEADQGPTSEVCTVCNGAAAQLCASCGSSAKKTKARNRPSKKRRDKQKAFGVGPYAA